MNDTETETTTQPQADEENLAFVRKVSHEMRLAFSMQNAAQLLDISYASIRREIARGKLDVTPTFKLITKKELLRYLAQEEQLARRKKKSPG